MEISCVLAQHRRGDDNGFDVSEMATLCSKQNGLAKLSNGHRHAFLLSLDVVTSTCFPRILFMSHKLDGT